MVRTCWSNTKPLKTQNPAHKRKGNPVGRYHSPDPHQDSDASESADSDGEVRERGGAEDLCEDEQRGWEVVRRLEQQQCGGRGLNRR